MFQYNVLKSQKVLLERVYQWKSTKKDRILK